MYRSAEEIYMARMMYIRFGDIPCSGKSIIMCGDEKIGEEAGVSVYVGIEIDDKIHIVLPSLTESSCVSLSGCLKRKMYEVAGDIVGIGSDGETLLSDVCIVRVIR